MTTNDLWKHQTFRTQIETHPYLEGIWKIFRMYMHLLTRKVLLCIHRRLGIEHSVFNLFADRTY